MNEAKVLSLEFNIQLNHSANIIQLLDEGATIPFIARYRKELHGSLDDQILRAFSDRLTYLRSLNKRKEEVTKLITEQEKMTLEIAGQIDSANTLTEIEDIYRPFKPKKKKRVQVKLLKRVCNHLQMLFYCKTLKKLLKNWQNLLFQKKKALMMLTLQ